VAEKKDLTGKVALVSGGSRGIGAAVALRLAREGARIVVGYKSDVASAERVIAELAAAGSAGHAVAADIARPDECERLVAQALEIFGRLDILANVAGVAAYLPLAKADADHFHTTFDANVLGALALTRAAAPVMTAPGGRIIHFSSRLAQTPLAGSAVYAASKAAVSALVLALAQELGPLRITINAVAPGVIETDMTAGVIRERGEAIRSQTPLRRIGQPEDIAGLVAFLASDDGVWINGRTIRADGGML